MLFCLMLLPSAATAAGGTEEDPVVTRSYLYESYLPSILAQADTMIQARFGAMEEDFIRAMDERGSVPGLYAAWLRKSGYSVDTGYPAGNYLCREGTVLALFLGTGVTVVSGSAEAVPANGALVDVTAGEECAAGSYLLPGHCYLSAGDMAAGVRILSDSAELTLTGGFAGLGMSSLVSVSGTVSGGARYTTYANALYSLRLFLGTDRGFELERTATRVEGIVMLIRLLGEESAALACQDRHPFRDVPAWAEKYVAYAYEKGYTVGVSSRAFAPDMELSAAQYLTLVLRALGYDDGAGDFYWETAGDKAVEAGIITSSENRSFASDFLRDHVAYTSYQALSALLKDSAMTLADRLIDQGVITAEAYRAARVR